MFFKGKNRVIRAELVYIRYNLTLNAGFLYVFAQYELAWIIHKLSVSFGPYIAGGMSKKSRRTKTLILTKLV